MDPLGIGSLEIRFCGESLILAPDRALFWPDKSCLVVADIHFGKAAFFRHHGMAIPEGDTASDLERLSILLEATAARRLVIAGDLLHAPSAKTPQVREAVASWRSSHSSVEIILVSGNHDRASGQLPGEWSIIEAGGAFAFAAAPLAFVHDPADAGATPDRGHICGHLHPAVRLTEGRLRPLKAPCFWQRETAGQLVLPGFGSFTGSKAIAPADSDRIFALAAGSVVEISPRLLANRSR